MPVTMRKTGSTSWEISFSTKASPEEVYNYLSDFTCHPEWAATLVKLTQTSEGPAGVGTTYRTEESMRGGSGPKAYTLCEITAQERPRRIAWNAQTEEQRGILAARSQWAFLIEPEGQGSRVTQQVKFVPPANPLVLRVFGIVTDTFIGGAGASPRMTTKNIERLQQILDSRVAAR